MDHAQVAVAEVPAESRSAPPSSRKALWLQLLVVAILAGWLYHRTLIELASDWWTNPNFSHGFIIPLFSGFLVWSQKKRLAAIPLAGSWWGLGIVALSLITLVVGTLGAELFLSRASFILLLAGVVITFLGWRAFRALLFPWACLFLMVPLPAIVFNEITFPLQLLASRIASALLALLGIPVLRDGNIIRLAAMPLEVAEACSGIRSLISLVTLALIYGYFLEPRIFRRVLLVAAAVPITIAANALRVMATGIMVQYWDPVKALGFFHEFSGWLIFLLSLGLLVATHSGIRVVSGWMNRGKEKP